MSACTLAAGCGSSATTNVSTPTAPTSARCQPSVTNSAPSFEAAGGTGNLAITVARECSWSVASQAGWIALTSSATGQGDGSVSYRIAENADPVTRQGTVAVSDVQVSISQKAAPCRYEVAAAQDAIQSTGGTAPIEVRAHAACSWTASADVPYADVTPKNGSGTATVNLIVQPNAGAERMVAAIVAGQHLALPQRAAAASPAPAPAPSPGPPPSPAPSPAPAPAPSPSPEPSPTPAPTPTPTPTPPPAPSPTPVSQIDFEGKVDSLSGTCPLLTMSIKTQTVLTTSSTEFKRIPCKDIKKGTDLKVSGWRMSDGTIQADVVEKK